MAQRWNEGMQSPDDMILANGAAEQQETQALREAANTYAREIEELKALYRKNNEMIGELRRMNVETAKGVQTVIENTPREDGAAASEKVTASLEQSQTALLGEIEATQEKIADLIQESNQFNHKENVRVYRNIQAATDQLLQDQTKTLSNQLDTLKDAVHEPKKNPLAAPTFVLVLLLFLYEIADSLGLVQLVIRLVTGG
ncbi:MAG: hypothetical protein LKH04_02780 [Lachnospiraceae bacterium]|jgi:prefoldin subunit 5|nr:hypothetical protein [Lachnospiraceae bacterium]MCI1397550.1 hypothetical protein [Lachnospiraceae bacterium]MCI1423215.1 hypothetical protein [Lachnospiraceae bacterium]MCI1452768.1 hypothetical protein [Lachnospiraceae bacterium]MDD5849728.1 hypothetical protein [Bacillota bacterium]